MYMIAPLSPAVVAAAASSSEAILMGLVGEGVLPSLTPGLHMQEGKSHGLTLVDRPIDLGATGVAAEALSEVLDWAERLGFDALNVTYPCKQTVIPLLERLDPVATAVGAVNTVLFTPDGRIGYNTDTTGFERAFRAALRGVNTRRVVQVAAGGAGAAVADALLRLGTEELVVVDLDADRARRLADALSERHRREVWGANLNDLHELLGTSDGVVNCSPIGMHNHPGVPFDPKFLEARHWVADIVYRPIDTELLTAARAAGCRTMHGGHMAVGQAADTFQLVTGRPADIPRMQQHFQHLIDNE